MFDIIRRLGFWGFEILKREKIAPHLKELNQFLNEPLKVQALSQVRLKKFLEHACTTTRFYRPYSGSSELTDFPVIQKRTIKERYSDFMSESFDKRSLVPTTTSGSYGTPFTFYLTKEKKARQLAEIICFGQWLGYRIGMKHAYVRVTQKKGRLILFLQNEILMDPTNLDRDWLEKQRHALLNRGIKILIGYPSAILTLAEYCTSKGDSSDRFPLIGVETIGEPLYDTVRNKIQHTFGCKVLSRYSTEELGLLAHECENGRKHHLNLASYVIEVLSRDNDFPIKPGEAGRVVVTDLFSHAMPLIRYDIGDLAVLADKCSCGIDIPSFEKIEGREIEAVYTPKGIRISPFAINGAMRDFEGVIQFQFIQNGKKTYKMVLCVLPEFQEEEIVMTRLKGILGQDAQVEIEYATSIPPLRSGKRPYIINNYRKS